jgi:AbrB family looped-hinge helix DNA binding protein
MKATITSKGQITIPVGIRVRLGLKTGQVLEFDETSPFVKAVPVFDESEMHSVVGCAKGRLGRSSDDWLDETRGPAESRKGTQ